MVQFEGNNSPIAMPAMAPPAIRLPLERPPEFPDPMELLLEWASSTKEVIVRRITASEYILAMSSALCQEELLIFVLCRFASYRSWTCNAPSAQVTDGVMSDHWHTSLTQLHHTVQNGGKTDSPRFKSIIHYNSINHLL